MNVASESTRLSEWQLRQRVRGLQAEAKNLARSIQSLRPAPPAMAPATPSAEAPPVAAPVQAKAAAPAAAPAPKLSMASRIAALGKDFDPNARDANAIDTGTPAAAFEAAAEHDEEDGHSAEEMIHVATDGAVYWGEIDNESARARAKGDKLIIDQEECIHCGTCVENTAAVFVLPNDSKAVAYRQDGPMDLIQDAIDACPVTCIHWTEDVKRFKQLNDAQGNPLHD